MGGGRICLVETKKHKEAQQKTHQAVQKTALVALQKAVVHQIEQKILRSHQALLANLVHKPSFYLYLRKID